MDEAVAARIAALEHAVADLQAQLAQRRQPMSRTLRCTCGGTRILHSRFAYAAAVPIALTSGMEFAGARPVSYLEQFSCIACGYVEWHCPDFSQIVVDGRFFVVHDSQPPVAPPADPYR